MLSRGSWVAAGGPGCCGALGCSGLETVPPAPPSCTALLTGPVHRPPPSLHIRHPPAVTRPAVPCVTRDACRERRELDHQRCDAPERRSCLSSCHQVCSESQGRPVPPAGRLRELPTAGRCVRGEHGAGSAGHRVATDARLAADRRFHPAGGQPRRPGAGSGQVSTPTPVSRRAGEPLSWQSRAGSAAELQSNKELAAGRRDPAPN